MAEKIKEGWTWLSNSNKQHYFVGHESLCKEWGLIDNSALQTGYNSPCLKCLKAFKKRNAEAA
jgi:hypothetical protein